MNNEIVKYKAGELEIVLSEEEVVKSLVRGSGKPTKAEIALFMNQCKMTGLNPFIRGEIFLITYYNSPAAVVVGHPAFIRKAEESRDYRGLKSGIIYIDKKGALQKSNGVMPPDAQLMGAWCKVHRKKKDDIYVEVPFSELVKTKKDGRPNTFWESMPVTMSVKCVEARALRKAGYLTQYISEEMPEPDYQSEAPLRNVSPSSQDASSPVEQAGPAWMKSLIEAVSSIQKESLPGDYPYKLDIFLDKLREGKLSYEYANLRGQQFLALQGVTDQDQSVIDAIGSAQLGEEVQVLKMEAIKNICSADTEKPAAKKPTKKPVKAGDFDFHAAISEELSRINAISKCFDKDFQNVVSVNVDEYINIRKPELRLEKIQNYRVQLSATRIQNVIDEIKELGNKLGDKSNTIEKEVKRHKSLPTSEAVFDALEGYRKQLSGKLSSMPKATEKKPEKPDNTPESGLAFDEDIF